MSFLVTDGYSEKLYDLCPEERIAEIKSYEEIIKLINYISNNRLFVLPEILDNEKLRRLLRGYHYSNSSINAPIIDYFTYGNKCELLEAFDFSTKRDLNERFKYGFPISTNEYGISMKKLILSLNKNFNNKINIV